MYTRASTEIYTTHIKTCMFLVHTHVHVQCTSKVVNSLQVIPPTPLSHLLSALSLLPSPPPFPPPSHSLSPTRTFVRRGRLHPQTRSSLAPLSAQTLLVSSGTRSSSCVQGRSSPSSLALARDPPPLLPRCVQTMLSHSVSEGQVRFPTRLLAHKYTNTIFAPAKGLFSTTWHWFLGWEHLIHHASP